MDDFHSVYFCTSVSSFFVISSNDIVSGAAKNVTGLTNAPLGQASSSSLSGLPVVMQKVSPGVSYVVVNEDTATEMGMSSMRYQYADDDCGWLEVVEKLPTASRVVSVLAPSIQRAIQEKTSVHVVSYQGPSMMNFLYKWNSFLRLINNMCFLSQQDGYIRGGQIFFLFKVYYVFHGSVWF